MILILIEYFMVRMECINLLLAVSHKFWLLFKTWVCCRAANNSFYSYSWIVLHVTDTMVAWGEGIIKKVFLLFLFFFFFRGGGGKREQDKKCREEGLALESRRATWNIVSLEIQTSDGKFEGEMEYSQSLKLIAVSSGEGDWAKVNGKMKQLVME